MLIIGAGGHAKEILEIVLQQLPSEIAFYDDVTPSNDIDIFFAKYQILRTPFEMSQLFKQQSPDFILGIGGINARQILWEKSIGKGGNPVNLIAANSSVAKDLIADKGLSVMQMAFISNSVKIGKAALINARVNIHHDVSIGDFCEIGPVAILLGKCKIGNNVFIGAGAIILPGIKIGDNCIVGAGSIVTQTIDNNQKVKGNPAK